MEEIDLRLAYRIFRARCYINGWEEHHDYFVRSAFSAGIGREGIGRMLKGETIKRDGNTYSIKLREE